MIMHGLSTVRCLWPPGEIGSCLNSMLHEDQGQEKPGPTPQLQPWHHIMTVIAAVAAATAVAAAVATAAEVLTAAGGCPPDHCILVLQ